MSYTRILCSVGLQQTDAAKQSQRFIAVALITSFLILSNTTLVFAAVPGFTPGQFSVDQIGAANYSIPIVVPPGTAGMQPDLSLNYTSRRGNGLLGVGWSFGGLSAITRCPATIAQDGFIDGVDFDSNDRFCLNGKRLIGIGTGTDTEGTYTEYRTEIESFIRIRSYGTAGSGPQKFKVWSKSGRIMQYAFTTDSRIEAQGKNAVLVWAVNRIEDTVGNYMEVTYWENEANGEYRPNRINYTGNDLVSPGLSPYVSVVFGYETRSDQFRRYLGGSLINNTHRLKSVATYLDYGGVNQELVKTYTVNYDENGSSNLSRITDIEECDSIGGCLSKTEFLWQDGNDGQFIDSYQGTTSGIVGTNWELLSNVVFGKLNQAAA